MTQINPTYILKLIEASEALSDEKKTEIKQKLSTLSVAQLGQIQNALEEEQQFNAQHYREVGQIRTHAAEQKIKKIYHYAEAKLAKEEAGHLEALESELETLED